METLLMKESGSYEAVGAIEPKREKESSRYGADPAYQPDIQALRLSLLRRKGLPHLTENRKEVHVPFYSPSYSPAPSTTQPTSLQLAVKQLASLQLPSLRFSKSTGSTGTPAANASGQPVADQDPANPQVGAKARYLHLFVIITVIVAVFLIIGLSILLYFALSTHSSWTTTAHQLCQAKYGKCAMFAGETPLAYPHNCTLIPCRYRCFYPTMDLDRIDPKYKAAGNGLFVSGKDGLICHTHSLCKDKTCVRTSAEAYEQKIDPKSAVECVKTMYGGVSTSTSGCIDSDKCHKGYDCMVKDQIEIGFNISCSGTTLNTCIDIHSIGCRTRCAHVDNTTNEAYLKRLREHRCQLDRNGKCYHTCDGRSTLDAPSGVPCTYRRKGYCWKGRCFESERFTFTEDAPSLIDENCYGRNANGTCFKDTIDYCTNEHQVDKHHKSMTRYGYNCISWDRRNVIPKKYHKLRSYGCILHDKIMPWCYSTNPNVVWNYCYNICPHKGLDEKDSTGIRVITFSFSEQGDDIQATAENLANHIGKLKPDIILTSSWPARKTSKWMNTLKDVAFKDWKVCGDQFSQNMSSIFIRESNGTTMRLLALDAYRSIGCKVTKIINNRSHTLAIIATDLHEDSRSTGLFCKDSPRGGDVCTQTVPVCERGRIADARRLIDVVRKYFGHNFWKTDIILGGSFNQPSHLDWTPEAAHLHCNATYSWSISNLMKQAGYQDSYRYIWKDPSLSPGITWSPLDVYRKRPQDRLDYIYFKGSSLEPTRADTYPISEPGKHLKKNWPSDRYTVVVDYRFKH